MQEWLCGKVPCGTCALWCGVGPAVTHTYNSVFSDGYNAQLLSVSISLQKLDFTIK